MKRLKIIFISIIGILLIPSLVLAKQTGTITVSSTNQVVVGNKVTVTVKISSNTLIGSWQMQLNYDKNYLQLTSASSEAGGVMMANSSSTGVKSKSYTFTFKTLKKGTTKVSVSSYEAYDFNDPTSNGEIELTSSSKSIKIITQEELEASYSKDNNLKSLSIEGYTLDPVFNKDTLNYSINVPEGTTSIKVSATPSDSKSHVSGDGTIEVSEGINTINVVVRAENGSEKTYTILVNVIDENPINVNIANLNYTVIKLRNNYVCPELYTESEVNINGFNIPACYNEKTLYTLVGLKKDDGTVENFIYDNGNYTKYLETIGTSLKVIILDYKDSLKGFKKYTETIDNNDYTVFKTNAKANNYIVYGINVLTGEKDFYNYDSINKTFTLFDQDYILSLNELNRTYLYIIIAFGAGLFLSIIYMFSLNHNKKKNIKKNIEKKENNQKKNNKKEDNKKDKKKENEKKKKQKKEIEENIIKEDINEIKEIVNKEEETKEFYDIFEDDRKKKKK